MNRENACLLKYDEAFELDDRIELIGVHAIRFNSRIEELINYSILSRETMEEVEKYNLEKMLLNIFCRNKNIIIAKAIYGNNYNTKDMFVKHFQKISTHLKYEFSTNTESQVIDVIEQILEEVIDSVNAINDWIESV